MGSKRALFTETYFKNLANAIRGLLKTKRTYKVSEMAEAINSFDSFEYQAENLCRTVILDKYCPGDFETAKKSGMVVFKTLEDTLVYYPAPYSLLFDAVVDPPENRDADWSKSLGLRYYYQDYNLPDSFIDNSRLINGVETTELVWSDEFKTNVIIQSDPNLYRMVSWTKDEGFLGIDKPLDMDDWEIKVSGLNDESSDYFKRALASQSKTTYKDLFNFNMEDMRYTLSVPFIPNDKMGSRRVGSMVGNDVYMIRILVDGRPQTMIILSISADPMVWDATKNELRLPYMCVGYNVYRVEYQSNLGLQINGYEYTSIIGGIWKLPNDDINMGILRNTAPIYDSNGTVFLAPNCVADEIFPNYSNPDNASWSLPNTPFICTNDTYLFDVYLPCHVLSPGLLNNGYNTGDIEIIEFNVVPEYTGDSVRYIFQAFEEGYSGNWAPLEAYVDDNLIFYVNENASNTNIELGDCSGKDVKIEMIRDPMDYTKYYARFYINGIRSRVLVTKNHTTKFMDEVIFSTSLYRATHRIHLSCFTGNPFIGTINKFNFYYKKRGDN